MRAIGYPGGAVESLSANNLFDRVEGKARPLAGGQGQEQPRANLERGQRAARIGLGADAGHNIGVDPKERPFAGDTVIGADEIERYAAQHGRYIDMLRRIAGQFVSAGAQFDHRRVDTGATGNVGSGQPQAIESIRQTAPVKRRERACQIGTAFAQQGDIALPVDQLQRPAVEIAVVDGPGNREGRGNDSVIDRAVEQDAGRILVQRIADLEALRDGLFTTICIPRGDGEDIFARRARNHGRPTIGVEQHVLTVKLNAQGCDVRQTVGHGMDQHILTRRRRETGRQFQADHGRHRLDRGAQQYGLPDLCPPVIGDQRDGIIARLAGTGGPDKFAGDSIEGCPFGQILCGECQDIFAVRIARPDGEPLFFSDQEGVEAFVEHRQAVDIGHPDRDVDRIDSAQRVGRGEAQDMITGLRIARRPLNFAPRGDEQHAFGQAVGRLIDDGIGIGVARDDAEHHRRAFPRQLQAHRHEHRRLIGIGDRQYDRFAAA